MPGLKCPGGTWSTTSSTWPAGRPAEPNHNPSVCARQSAHISKQVAHRGMRTPSPSPAYSRPHSVRWPTTSGWPPAFVPPSHTAAPSPPTSSTARSANWPPSSARPTTGPNCSNNVYNLRITCPRPIFVKASFVLRGQDISATPSVNLIYLRSARALRTIVLGVGHYRAVVTGQQCPHPIRVGQPEFLEDDQCLPPPAVGLLVFAAGVEHAADLSQALGLIPAGADRLVDGQASPQAFQGFGEPMLAQAEPRLVEQAAGFSLPVTEFPVHGHAPFLVAERFVVAPLPQVGHREVVQRVGLATWIRQLFEDLQRFVTAVVRLLVPVLPAFEQAEIVQADGLAVAVARLPGHDQAPLEAELRFGE